MVWTTLGYSESQDSATLADVASLADNSVTNTGTDKILVPKFASKLAAAMGIGVSITQARVVAPSLEAFNNVDIGGLNVNAEPLSPTPFMHFFQNPIPLTVNEELGFQAAEDGATVISSGVVWLMDKLDPVASIMQNGKVVKLPIRSIRGTGTQTLVADAWTSVTVALGQSLKAGRYQAVGLRAISATGVAARYVFQGEPVNHRPGCIAYDTVADIENPIFRAGRLGVWGEFEHNQIPTIEMWARGADTTQEFILDVVKIK